MPCPVVSLAVASVVAGGLVGLEFAMLILFADIFGGEVMSGSLGLSMYVATLAATAFGVGALFFGSPLWLWLHSIGKRSYLTAAIAGSVLASTGAVAWAVVFGGTSAAAVTMFGWVVLPGAVAGLLIRRIAYEPQPTPPPAPPS